MHATPPASSLQLPQVRLHTNPPSSANNSWGVPEAAEGKQGFSGSSRAACQRELRWERPSRLGSVCVVKAETSLACYPGLPPRGPAALLLSLLPPPCPASPRHLQVGASHFSGHQAAPALAPDIPEGVRGCREQGVQEGQGPFRRSQLLWPERPGYRLRLKLQRQGVMLEGRWRHLVAVWAPSEEGS